MRQIRRWIALTVASMILLTMLPFASGYASAIPQDLTGEITVLPTYFLPQGSSWVDSGQSDPAKLPWSSDVTMQEVAVCWILKDPSMFSASTGDYFTFTLPLDFVAEAESNVYSASGSYIGLASFTKDGFVRVEINTSGLFPTESSPQSGFIPFQMLRPTATGGGSSGSGASSSDGSNSSGTGTSSSSSSQNSSQSGVSGSDATAPPAQQPDSQQSVQTTESSATVSTEPTTPPSTSGEGTVTVIAGPTSPKDGTLSPLVEGRLGTLVLTLASAGILFLALLVFLKRQRSLS